MKLVPCVGPSMTLPCRTRLRRKQAKLQLPGLVDDIRYGSRLSVASSKFGPCVASKKMAVSMLRDGANRSSFAPS